VDGYARGRSGEQPAVAQQRPEHVDEPSGQGEQGLGVDESFAAFLVVEDAGGAVAVPQRSTLKRSLVRRGTGR
jgi:hypothetical protein